MSKKYLQFLNDFRAMMVLSPEACKVWEQTDYIVIPEDNDETSETTFTVTDGQGMVIMSSASIKEVNYLFENWEECL